MVKTQLNFYEQILTQTSVPVVVAGATLFAVILSMAGFVVDSWLFGHPHLPSLYLVTLMPAIFVAPLTYLFIRYIRQQADLAQDLDQAQSRIEQAQTIAHLGNWEWDISSNEVWWSSESYRIFGFDLNNVAPTYENFLSIVHPDDRDFVNSEVTAALAGKRLYDIHHRVLRPNGEERIVHEQGQVDRDETGSPIFMIGTVHDVTDQHRRDRMLRENQQIFTKAFHASPAMSVLLEPDSAMIIDANDSWLENLEFTRDEAVAYTTEELNVWRNLGDRDELMRRMRADGRMRGFEARLQTRTGKTREWIMSGEYVEYEGLQRLLVVSYDMTERNETERALTASEKRFRDYASTIADRFWETDNQHRYVYFSSPTEHLYLPVDELIGKTHWEVEARKPIEGNWDMLRSHLDAREAFRGIRFSWQAGGVETRRFVEIAGVPFFNDDGSFAGYRGTATDISDEEEAQELNRRFRQLFENANDAIFIIDPEDGRFLDLNERASQYLGYTRDELLTMTVPDINPGSPENTYADYASNVLKQGHLIIESEHVRKDGSVVPVEVSSRAIDYGHQKVVQSFVRDITERRESENLLRESEERHRHFAADAAHELRTPLAVLRTHLDNLEDRKAATSLVEDVDSMSRMVEQLLAESRLENLTVQDDEEADLLEVGRNVAIHLAPIAVREGRSIEVVGTDDPVMVRGNSAALEQAVRNLVENAIKYSARGTTVTVRVNRENGEALLSVIDRGRGVSPEQRDTIFERFKRADLRSGGAGLGLAIVLRTVEAHDGTIDVFDAPEGGADFTLHLPSLTP